MPYIDVTAARDAAPPCATSSPAAAPRPLLLARGVGQVRDVLERSAESDALAPGVYPSVAEAVAALRAQR